MWHFIWVIIVIEAKRNDAFYGTLWEKIIYEFGENFCNRNDEIAYGVWFIIFVTQWEARTEWKKKYGKIERPKDRNK